MATVFTITELRRTGAGLIAATPTVFRWTGDQHSAPVGDIPLQLQVTTNRTEVPGGVEAVEQVLTVAWQPFTIRGQWSDKWLRRGRAPGAGTTARQTFEAFTELVGRAPLVRIEFDGLTLEGLITNLQIAYRRAAVIGWEVTFSPHRFGAGVARVEARRVRPLRGQVAAISTRADLLEARRATLAAIPRKGGLMAKLEAALDKVNEGTAAARASVESGLDNDAIRGLQQAAATLRGVRDAAHGIALAAVAARSDVSVAFDDGLNTLRFVDQSRHAVVEALGLAGQAAEAERDARALARTEPRAIHHPAVGESLYAISDAYYGTPDGWRTIYDANHLTSLRLAGTEELVIPERAA